MFVRAVVLYLKQNLLLSVMGKQVKAWAWASEKYFG